MKKYALTIDKVPGSVIFGFEDRTIKFMSIEMDMAPLQVEWLVKHLPYEEQMLDYFKGLARFVVAEIPDDLEFETFWNTYDYKVGKKERARKLWAALWDAERVKVLKAIPQYKNWLAQKNGIETLFPETFLSQRRWENHYKI